MTGTSITFNKKKAMVWFKKAAAKGYVKAWYRLGQLHYEAKYEMRNYSAAHRWFSRAARKNHGVSQYYMALLYQAGRGVQKDLDYALIWANRAKKNGISDATRLITKLNKLTKKQTPTIQKVVRSTAPTPRKSRRKRRGDVAIPRNLGIRKILVSGGWNEGDMPSDYIPSHSNKCENVNSKIRCTSKRLKITRPAYIAHYRIVSLITNFGTKGAFTIKSRRNYLFILPDDPDDPAPTVDMPETGLEKKVSILDCKVLAKTRIRCYKKDKSVIRFTKI